MTVRDEETERQGPSMGAEAEELPPYVSEIVVGEGDVPEFAGFVNRPMPALLVVLTGPSGVGKDVTLQRMSELGLNFHYVVTVTTRAQRPDERDGEHYFFKSRQEYEQMKKNGELLEDAEVYGNYYGIPRSQVVEPLRKGIDVIMKPDVQGAHTMREKEPDAIYIFLAPPSMEDLASRLYHRKTEDPQELKKRLELAREEMHAISDFDYVVVNRNNELDETVEQIEAIIEAEKCRVRPRRIRLAEEVKAF